MMEGMAASNYPLGEEIANAVSHGIGALAGLIALPMLVVAAAGHSALAAIGAAVFGLSVLLLYLSSTLYHAISNERAKRVLRRFDHSAIYLLIAGTYTPFTLTVLRGAGGYWLLAAVWGLAVLGITLKGLGRLNHPVLSSGLYIAMGWIALLAIKPLWQHVPFAGLVWLVAGGVCYTAGVPFYASKRIRWAHFVWHLFVVAGTVCHYVAVVGYAS